MERYCPECKQNIEICRRELPQKVSWEMNMKPLGKLKRTARGFELIEFKDCYGTESSLQASSMALLAKPGTSAVWLGNDHEAVNPADAREDGCTDAPEPRSGYGVNWAPCQLAAQGHV